MATMLRASSSSWCSSHSCFSSLTSCADDRRQHARGLDATGEGARTARHGSRQPPNFQRTIPACSASTLHGRPPTPTRPPSLAASHIPPVCRQPSSFVARPPAPACGTAGPRRCRGAAASPAPRRAWRRARTALPPSAAPRPRGMMGPVSTAQAECMPPIPTTGRHRPPGGCPWGRASPYGRLRNALKPAASMARLLKVVLLGQVPKVQRLHLLPAHIRQRLLSVHRPSRARPCVFVAAGGAQDGRGGANGRAGRHGEEAAPPQGGTSPAEGPRTGGGGGGKEV